MASFPRLAVVTIEGGGTFGFSLLGQLQAVVESDIVPVALAGTSAGAIIAALHWAGYTPMEIREKLCNLADRKLITDLMGPFDEGSDGYPFDFDAFLALRQRFLPAFFKARNAYKQVRLHLDNRGLFCGDELVNILDRWLRTAPNLDDSAQRILDDRRPGPETVTFGDYGVATASRPLRPLFLPVTNVTKRQLELVCSIDPDYANWSIARAVRASAGFPGFFRPTSFGHAPEESYYVDGGVIANYPAWIFGHQFRGKLYGIESGREFAIRPWLHVGLCLGPPANPQYNSDRGRTAKSFVGNLVRLLAGGARQELERQLVNLLSRSIEIDQPEDETDAPESFLDFAKCDRERIEKMFDRGRSVAEGKLAQYVFEQPEAMTVERMLRELVEKALVCFGQTREDGRPDNSRMWLRANVFMPVADATEQWKIMYSVNMNGDPDAEFTLEKFAGLTGMCFGLRRPVICNLEEIRKAAEGGVDTKKLFGMTKAAHMDVRSDRTWLASVPVFDQYADYPSRIGEDVRHFDGRQYQEFVLDGDGAVMAVLNLDGAVPFQQLRLDPSPEVHWTDVRVRSIIDIMRSVAVDLGTVFSTAFGRNKETASGHS
jgi:predicted acylesterase/phospholipase RssA